MLSFATSINGQAQTIAGNWLNYTTYEGLPSNTIQCITKDSSGFIWIGTNAGLSRFDGVRFTNFYNSPNDTNSIPGNDIKALFVDDKNKLWIACSNAGVCCIDLFTNKKTIFRNNPNDTNSLATNGATFIRQDNNGNIWIGVWNKGIDRYNEKAGTFSHFNFAPLSSPNYNLNECSNAVKDSKGNFWIIARCGFTCFNPVTCKSKSFFPKDTLGGRVQNENQLLNICLDADDNLLFGHYKKVLQFNTKTELFDTLFFTCNNEVLSLCISLKSKNELYIGSYNGLGLYNLKTKQFRLYEPEAKNRFSILTDTSCYSLLLSDGILFVGFRDGLSVLSPASQILQPQELQWDVKKNYTPTVISQLLYLPNSKHFYVSTSYDFGVYLYHPDTGIIRKITGDREDLDVKYKSLEDKTKYIPVVYSVEQDKKIPGLYYCSTHIGVFCFDIKTEALYKYNFVADDSIQQEASKYVSAMFVDKHNTLWVATKKYFLHIDVNTNKLIASFLWPTMPDEKARWNINNIYQLKNGDIWVATSNNRIYVFDIVKSSFKEKFGPHCKHQLQNKVEVFLELPDDRIYLGTYASGLACYFTKLDSFYFFSNTESFIGTQIFAIITDARNGLWVSTNNALNYLRHGTKYFKNYTKYNGYLMDTENNLFTYKNLVFLTQSNSITTLDINNFWKDKLPPNVEISAMKVHNQTLVTDTSIAFKKNLFFDYTQNTLSFEFSAPNYHGAATIIYYYQLQGFKNEWISNGTRNFVSFAQLPPGDYVFKVKALNSDGVWSNQNCFVNIVIAPPYWQTWWFKCLIAFTILNLAYLLYRLRIKQIKKTEKIKYDYEKKLANLEMSALRAQMNPHFIFNCLNSINRYIVKSDPDTASAYVTKFARLIRIILDNSRSNEVSLSNEILSLKLYIEMEAMRFDNKFEFTINLNPKIDADALLVPPMIMQPYVENAIWHGLMHKETSGHLTITIYDDEQYIYTTFDDDGVGRNHNKKADDNTFTKHNSHGMMVTKSRLAIFNNAAAINDNITITDKVDSHGVSLGTSVQIKIVKKYLTPTKQ